MQKRKLDLFWLQSRCSFSGLEYGTSIWFLSSLPYFASFAFWTCGDCLLCLLPAVILSKYGSLFFYLWWAFFRVGLFLVFEMEIHMYVASFSVCDSDEWNHILIMYRVSKGLFNYFAFFQFFLFLCLLCSLCFRSIAAPINCWLIWVPRAPWRRKVLFSSLEFIVNFVSDQWE